MCFFNKHNQAAKPVRGSGLSLLIQAVIVIRGFVIRSFEYLRIVNFVQSLLSADIITLGYLWILVLAIRSFGICGIFFESNLRE
jgi:hypothetical protein